MINVAETYRKQQVLTAAPETLTLMLYNGCLKFIKEGINALDSRDYETGNIYLQKAENIISELRYSLNMDYEISQQLLPLYDFCYNNLVKGNMKSDREAIIDVQDIITELRDAWAQAMKTARQERAVSYAMG